MRSVIGFDQLTVPTSPFRPSAVPMGATGFGAQTSLFNIQKRVALAPGPTAFWQNVQSRVPTGWADNPYSGRTQLLTGNGFSMGQV